MTDRIWDRFLTDADRAWVAARRKKPVGFGRKAALLVIDLYREIGRAHV